MNNLKMSLIIYIPKDFPKIFFAIIIFIVKIIFRWKEVYFVSWSKDVLSFFQNYNYKIIHPSSHDFNTENKPLSAYKLYNILVKSVVSKYQHILSDDNLTFGYINCIGIPASLKISQRILDELKPSMVIALPGRDSNRLGHAIAIEAKLRKIYTLEPFPLLFIKLKYFRKNFIFLLNFSLKLIFSNKSDVLINSDTKTILLFSSSEHQRQSISDNINDLTSNGYDIILIPGDLSSLIRSNNTTSQHMIKYIDLWHSLLTFKDIFNVFSCDSLKKSIYSNLISNKVPKSIALSLSIETALGIKKSVPQWSLIQKTAYKWLMMLNPSAIIETSPGHGILTNSLIRHANRINIPTIWLNWARFVSANNFDYLFSQSRYVFSIGMDLKRILDPYNFKDIHNSNFYSTDIGISGRKFDRSIKIGNGHLKTLVIITRYAHEELGLESVYTYEDAVSWINDILTSFNQEVPSSKILLKEHVWGDSILQGIDNKFNNYKILNRYKSAEYYLNDCDIVIVSYSSMMIKAVENKKIVIVYWPYKYFEYDFETPIIKYNAVLVCNSYRELTNCIYKIMNDKSYLQIYYENQNTFLNNYMPTGTSISKSLGNILSTNHQ